MNNKNQELEEIVNSKLKDISSLKNFILNEDEQISSIIIHLANLFDQLNETQNLSNAKILEIQSETNWQKLVKAEEGRLRQESEELQRRLVKLKERKQSQQSILTSLKSKAETLRTEFHVNHNQIYTWVGETIVKEHSDNKLQNFIDEDNHRIKKMNQQIEMLIAEELKKRKLVDQSVTNFKTCQCDLEKTTESFKLTHQECQKYIQQWEMTVEQIQARDEEIETQISIAMQSKEELFNLKGDIYKTEEQLKMFNNNNEQLSQKLTKAEREVTRLQMELTDLNNKRNGYQKEFDSLKLSKIKCERELAKIQTEKEFMEIKLNSGNHRLGKINRERKALLEELHREKNTTESAKTQEETLELWLGQERKYIENLKTECDSKNKDLVLKKIELNDAINEKKLKIREIEKLKSIDIGVINNFKKLEEELNAQSKMIQTKDEEIEHLQIRLSSLRSDTNQSDMNKNKCQMLGETIAAKTIACQMLNQDTQQQQNYISWQENELKKYLKKNKQLGEKVDELNFEFEVLQKELQELANTKQQLTVKEMVLKLEIRHLNDATGQTSASLDEIVKRRESSEQMIMKRQLLIKHERDAIEREIRLQESNKKQLTAQIIEISSKTTNLTNRYENEISPLKSWMGSEVKPVHFLMKVDEDKATLKLKNSKYEEKLQKESMDMATYQNTLQILSDKNEALWKSIYRSPENGILFENIMKMESELNEIVEIVNHKKSEANAVEENLRQQQKFLKQIEDDISNVTFVNDEKEQKLKELLTTIESHRTKQNRAFQLIAKIRKTARGNVHDDDILLKLIQNYNKTFCKDIADFLFEHEQIVPIIEVHLKNADFRLPHTSKRLSATSSKIKSKSGLPKLKQQYTYNSPPSTGDDRRSNSSRSTTSSLSIVKIEFGERDEFQAHGTKLPDQHKNKALKLGTNGRSSKSTR